MNYFHDERSEFASAGSDLQRLGALDRTNASFPHTVSLNPRVFQFGVFELDDETLELRREGRLIHLRHQPARVLRMLLERAGRLVSRNEITNELWPSDVDVDVEQGLNHCVKEVRAALGDRPESPRYLQTLPRRGYRMLMEVSERRADTKRPEPPSKAVNGSGPTLVTGARKVRVTISVARAHDHALLWSESYEREASDVETIERDLRAAFNSGVRPALQAARRPPGEAADEPETVVAVSRRGFE